MKRGLKIIAIMIATIVSINNVKAEEDTTTYIFNINQTLTKPTQEEMQIVNNNKQNLVPNNNTYILLLDTNKEISLIYFNNKNDYTTGVFNNEQFNLYLKNQNGTICTNIQTNNYSCSNINSFWLYENTNKYYRLYDYSDNIISSNNIEFSSFYNDNIQIKIGQKLPKLKDLFNYNSWSDYESNFNADYTEVNLDNYEYVLLSLKNYNHTQAFQTNLQVKGQIGITPIYNFGQTAKDSITGVQVQDRCNLAYKNYTSYPFYIIQSDLQNNAIYAVKECSKGSSFKFDNTIFNITYITTENKDNPTVTVNGKKYNVIPYEDLPSTATKNEEDNYIPGESGNATDSGGLDSAIKNVQQKMSEIWNTFSYFTDFVGQLFASLPTEVRTILLSAFVIAIILGLIKIFIN